MTTPYLDSIQSACAIYQGDRTEGTRVLMPLLFEGAKARAITVPVKQVLSRAQFIPGSPVSHQFLLAIDTQIDLSIKLTWLDFNAKRWLGLNKPSNETLRKKVAAAKKEYERHIKEHTKAWREHTKVAALQDANRSMTLYLESLFLLADQTQEFSCFVEFLMFTPHPNLAKPTHFDQKIITARIEKEAEARLAQARQIIDRSWEANGLTLGEEHQTKLNGWIKGQITLLERHATQLAQLGDGHSAAKILLTFDKIFFPKGSQVRQEVEVALYTKAISWDKALGTIAIENRLRQLVTLDAKNKEKFLALFSLLKRPGAEMCFYAAIMDREQEIEHLHVAIAFAPQSLLCHKWLIASLNRQGRQLERQEAEKAMAEACDSLENKMVDWVLGQRDTPFTYPNLFITTRQENGILRELLSEA